MSAKNKPGRPTDLEAAKRILARAGHISDMPAPPVIDHGGDDEGPDEAAAAAERRKPTLRQAMLVAELVKGCNIREAAERVGLTYSHARQTVNKPHIKALLDEIKQDLLLDARRELEGLRGLAVRRKKDLLLDPQTPHAVVAQVTDSILDRTGMSTRSEIVTEVSVGRVAALPTSDLLASLYRTLLAEGATEAEAAAKVEALRAKVAASP
jgi:hypothetical protein